VIANVFSFIVILLPGTERFDCAQTSTRTQGWPENARNVAPMGVLCVDMRKRFADKRFLNTVAAISLAGLVTRQGRIVNFISSS
jgi:hypothetical protein